MAMASHAAVYDGAKRQLGAGRNDAQSRHARVQGGWLFGAFAFALIFVAIVWAARSAGTQRPTPPAPASPWTKISRPIPLFDLSDTTFGAGPALYQAWRARSGPGRADVLTFGDFDKDSSFLRLSIEQPGLAAQPFFSALARQAALVGLAMDRSGVPDGVDSRFGLMSVADAVLSGRGRRRACLAFRVLDPAARISGLACGGDRRPFGRSELVCALDRLDLLGGGAESPLTLYFARTELARGRGCAADRLAPLKARATWLDAGEALPKLKADRLDRATLSRPPRSHKL